MSRAESEAVIAEAGGVSVEKRYEPDEFPVPAIAFTVNSTRDDPITVRMVDNLPDEVDPAHIGFHPDHGGEYWSVDESSVVFKRPFDPNEEYVTVYGLRHIYVDTASQFLVEPEIEILDPASDILGEDSGQHVRDIIAGESDSVQGLSADTGGQASASAPAVENIAESLAEEIRSGAVDDETLEVLRSHLKIESESPRRGQTQQRSGSGNESSTNARIRRLQADVSDLRAYTDALEGFLDENGEAQEILSDFREELDSLSPRVNSLETQLDEVDAELSNAVDDFSADINSMATDIDSIEGDLASLNEHTDSLSGDIDAVDSEIDSVSSDLSRLQSRVRRLDNNTATQEDVEEIRAELDGLADFRERMQSVFNG
jgi:predicted  nucleic acid-binding Zn-ribbon protein